MKLQRLMGYTRRACQDYNMIADGDRIAVGISGGKDSLALLTALHGLQRFYPQKYEMEGVTVALGLPGEDFSGIEAYCNSLGIRYTVVESDIGTIIFDERKEKNPCSLCAKLRKGALNERIKQLGCNSVAYGHNRDDVIETFFMSLFYEGRISSFRPVTYLSQMDLRVIRPLIYVPEDEIKSFVRKAELPVTKSPCPVNGVTKRAEIDDFIKDSCHKYKDFEAKIFGAISRSAIDGWSRPNMDDDSSGF